jgi:hypothetical protein
LETGFIYFTSSPNKLQITEISFEIHWHLNSNSFGADSNRSSLELRNASSYGRTPKETNIFTSFVSLSCALPWVCAFTNRLPRTFHIRHCVNNESSRDGLLNRYSRKAFTYFLRNGSSIIPVFSQTHHYVYQMSILGMCYEAISTCLCTRFS